MPTPSPLVVTADITPRVNLAHQQNHLPFFRRLEIRNPGLDAAVDIRVTSTATPPFFAPWDLRIDAIPAGLTHVVAPVPLVLAPDFLARQLEREVGFVEVGVSVMGAPPQLLRLPVEVLSPYEWAGVAVLPELLAAFVRPNARVLAPLLSDAAAWLGRATQDPSLAGYQGKDPRRVQWLAEAFYAAVQSSGVTYISPPASFEESGQKVRTHEQVLEQRLGTCLDLTVLFAALLEQVGLHPLLVFVQGHAFPGVWLTEFALQEPTLDNPRPIRKRVELGEALVFDSSAVAQGVPFDDARRKAEQALAVEGKFVLAIDVHCARTQHIRPLPFDANEDAVLPRANSGASASNLPPPLRLRSVDDLRFTQPAMAAASTEPGYARIERWKGKLLDLSLRNRLLNFRPTAKTCSLPHLDCGALEDALVSDTKLSLEPKLAARSLEARLQSAGGELADAAMVEVAREGQRRGVLHTDLTQAEHDKALTELWRQSRAAFDESGAVLLYVTLGMLEWFESKSSEAPRRAPLVLVPVLLERGGPGHWSLKRADEETRVNVTLLKKLEADFGIPVAGMDVLPEDASGIDIPLVLQKFRHLVREQDRWLVHDEIHLGLFSFHKFLMWLDLEAKQASLLQNPVVKHLLSGSNEPFALAEELVTDAAMDRVLRPEATLHVVDADPSQAAAIQAAAVGSSFVMQGPPGTGKSQTITNLIAQLLANGKTVLFVSEKRAALEVVQARLEKVGLGPFCLELHSNQASKAAVMQQLRASFEVTRGRDRSGWQKHAADLAQARGELNAYAELLRQPSPFGTTARGVLAYLFGKEAIPRIALPNVDIDGLTAEGVAQLEQSAGQLAQAVTEAGGLAGHPWRAVQRDDWDPQWQQQVQAAVRDLADCADVARRAQAQAATALDLPADLPPRALVDIARLVLSTPAPPPELLEAKGFDARVAEIRGALGRARELATSRDVLRRTWRDDLWQQNLAPLRARVQAWAGRFFLFAWVMLWGVRKALRPLAKGALPGTVQLATDLAVAEWQQGETRALAAADAPTRLGAVWRGADTDFSLADGILTWATGLRTVLRAIGSRTGSLASGHRVLLLATSDAELTAEGTLVGNALREWLAAAEALEVARSRAVDLLHIDTRKMLHPDSAPAAIAGQASEWLVSMPQLRNWCAAAAAIRTAGELGLEPLVDAVEQGTFPPPMLRDVLLRSLHEAWWEGRLTQEPRLRAFRGTSHGELIARFKDLDRQALHLAQQEVAARLAERAPDAQAPGDEMGLLRRQLTLQKRHMPIRQLFCRIPTTLKRLKPCVMMSPLSVAQYLDPTVEGFDAVIFDEASQIPPWDAVGAIARGKQVVVVGDSKQLPPTSFFDRSTDDDDDAEIDEEATQDTESILDEMTAARLRELPLKWHYRSKHESLIAFSNWHYYDNRLHTFPSAAAEVADLGVKLVRVNGTYDRGGSRTNKAEAEAVVDELFRLLALPDGERPSIGVVTFSQVQQRLVEDLVDRRLQTKPDLAKHFGDGVGEPVFVKNLENVQGDERDVMLFSVCYGPDPTGRVTANFGPLNRKGGERRLNVAVTRARRRLVVFTTLDWGKIDENKSRALGVAHLKAFLRYAALGPASLLTTTAAPGRDAFDSPFEQEVHRVLVAEGWQVHTQVGFSGYRLDLGVVDPDRPGTYLLGVECDGATYHSSRVARERDRLREDVLVSLGWRIHRVWSTDWWYDRDTAVQRLLQAVRDAQELARAGTPPPLVFPTQEPEAGPPIPRESNQDASAFAALVATPDAPAWPPDAVAFEPAIFRGTAWAREHFYHPDAKALIAHSVALIVHHSGPLPVTTVTRLIAGAWGFGRTGGQIAAYILDAVALLPPAERPVRVGDHFWQYWRDPKTWRGFRHPGEATGAVLAEAPPEEVANVAAWVIGRAIAISQPELLRETARVLGAKAGANILAGVETALPILVKTGRGQLVEGKWRVQ